MLECTVSATPSATPLSLLNPADLFSLFSRVEPTHKSKIVEYLQKEGAVLAMVSGGRVYLGCVMLYPLPLLHPHTSPHTPLSPHTDWRWCQ